MKIRTEEFTASPKQLADILIQNAFRQAWWFVSLFWGFATYSIVRGYYEAAISCTFWALVGLLSIMVYLRLSANSKGNRNLLKKCVVEIDEEYLIDTVEDGAQVKIKLSNLIKVIRVPRYHFFYITINWFVCVPLTVFASKEDIEKVDSILRNKGLL